MDNDRFTQNKDTHRPKMSFSGERKTKMKNNVLELAYKGEWNELLTLLRRQPELVNSASESKGYTPLHQAAWHGVKPAVVGALLALGANPTLRTLNKRQTARDIALEKHDGRGDLHFLLADKGRTTAQLIRKVAAENRGFFESYDGNQILCDRLIEAFGAEIFCQLDTDYEERLACAFNAVTGIDWDTGSEIPLSIGQSFCMHATPLFWTNRFLSAFRECAVRSQTTPIEKHWATVNDLFDPVPDGWGLRGDLYLWLEMRSALNHVPIPDRAEVMMPIISSLFFVLTGAELTSDMEVRVTRFERGGMSSGMVSGDFWHNTFIPMMQQRAQWLLETWVGR